MYVMLQAFTPRMRGGGGKNEKLPPAQTFPQARCSLGEKTREKTSFQLGGRTRLEIFTGLEATNDQNFTFSEGYPGKLDAPEKETM